MEGPRETRGFKFKLL